MTTSQEKLQKAMAYAMQHKPNVGGFPFLAECLKRAGVQKNLWALPSVQSIFVMKDEVIVQQGTPLMTGMATVPTFNEEALIAALRTDQAGQSTFPEFLQAAWQAGVIGYDVDFQERVVVYRGARGEIYDESYPAVDVGMMTFE